MFQYQFLMQHRGHESVKKYFLLQLEVFFPHPPQTLWKAHCVCSCQPLSFFCRLRNSRTCCVYVHQSSQGARRILEELVGGKTAAAAAKAVCLHVLDCMFFEFYQYVFHPPMCLPGTGRHAASFLVLQNNRGHGDEMRNSQRDGGTGRLRGKVILNAQKKEGRESDNQSLQKTPVSAPVDQCGEAAGELAQERSALSKQEGTCKKKAKSIGTESPQTKLFPRCFLHEPKCSRCCILLVFTLRLL